MAALFPVEVPCQDVDPFLEVAPFLNLEEVPCLVEDPCQEAVQSSFLVVAPSYP